MKNLFIKFISLILVFNFLFTFLFGSVNLYAATEVTLEEKQQAIVDIANSYYSKGKGIQYDQKRRYTNIKPEEATVDNPIYLDCSSFVYNVYLQAFGKKLRKQNNTKTTTYLHLTKNQLEEAKAIRNNEKYRNKITTNSYVPFYVDSISQLKKNYTKTVTSKNTNSKEKMFKINDLKSDFKDLLQVGDLVVYAYKGKTNGHVMLYIGNNQLIHCTGRKYDYKNSIDYTEDNGAIKIDSVDVLFDKTSRRYLLNQQSFAVIRPLNASYMKNAKLTNYAKLKSELTNLNVSTTNSSSGNLKTVNLGSTIKYTLSLKNEDTKAYSNILVNEALPEYLTLVENSVKAQTSNNESIELKNVTKTNNTLSCEIPEISSGSNVEITYKCKVNKNKNNLGKTIASQLKVGKKINNTAVYQNTNTVKNPIKRTLTTKEQDKIVSVAKNYIGKKYNQKTRNLIDTIYKKALNVNPKLGDSTIKSMFDNIMYTSGKTVKVKSNNTKTRKMLVENMYGYSLETYSTATTGTRSLTTSNLIPGDTIIYTYKNGKTDKYVIYLYLSETQLLTVSNGKVVTRGNSKEGVQKILNSIIGKDKFAVLRPSLDM